MEQDARADWQQQQEVERRAYEEEQARYRAEHPLWNRCLNHSHRIAVNPLAYDGRFCNECIEDRRARYAETMVKRDRDSNDPHNWPAERQNQGGWLGHTFTIPEKP